MKLFISGGTGFVGHHVTRHFLAKGHQVTITGSQKPVAAVTPPNLTYLQADTTRPGPWQEALQGTEVVINLAGRSIFKRWNARYKQQIYDSRILTTRNIVAALPNSSAGILLSASAVGYYGDGQEQVLTEGNPAGKDFLATLAQDWEGAAREAESRGWRVALLRFGVILGSDGGALAQMLPAFKFFAGGPVGHGRQWMAWMHIQDLIAAIEFLIHQESLSGAFNFCTPNPVRNRELAQTLGKCLNRPSFMPVPAMMLKLVMGEFGGVLLSSQRAVPENLLKAGFSFQFPDLAEALADLV